MLLRLLAPNRLVARCKHAPALAAARKIHVTRPVEPCSWSKRDEVLTNWEALRDNPSEWYDNRTRKQNDRQPDFVRKEDRSVAIWVDSRDTPEWADELLAELDSRRQVGGGRDGGRGGREGREEHPAAQATAEKWQNLREDPDAWFDNRNRKTNDRQPDFVLKADRSVALWLNGRFNPEWAEEVLAELDARPRGYQSGGGGGRTPGGDPRVTANWESLRDDPDSWYDNRKRKTSDRQPDFVRKDNRQMAIWLDRSDNPSWAEEVLYALEVRKSERAKERVVPEQDEAESWELLRSRPDFWFDNRDRKTQPEDADFRLKRNRRVELWLDSPAKPAWVDAFLPILDARREQRETRRREQEQEQQQQYGYDNQQPQQYYEDQQQYYNGQEQQPEAHQEQQAYAEDFSGQQQLSRSSGRGGDWEAKRAMEAANWESLRSEPELWYDNRQMKANERWPDFRRKDNKNVALWLNSRNIPEWLPDFLPVLDERQAQRAAARNAADYSTV